MTERRHARQRGFTLIEVMVALVIVAVALPALLLQVMSMNQNSAALRDKTIAHWVAENEFARLQLERRLQRRNLSGESHGQVQMAGVDWYWRVSTEATGVEGMQRLYIRVGVDESASLLLAERYLDHD